jgi:hypothetical protein
MSLAFGLYSIPTGCGIKKAIKNNIAISNNKNGDHIIIVNIKNINPVCKFKDINLFIIV